MMMGCDDALVERVGSNTVLEICALLGCSAETRNGCIPHSGHIDLCKECYDEVIKGGD